MRFRKAIALSLTIVLSPILIALASALLTHGNALSENSSGAYLWLLFLSIPLGAAFFLSNLLLRLIKKLKR